MNKQLRILSDDILNSNFVGFDRFFDQFANIASNSYPPHNIVRTGEDTQAIEFALAGFSADEVDISVEDSVVTITGEKTEEEDRDYIWHGISARQFTKNFPLTAYWEVTGAEFKDGILIISLKQEIPEAKRPKQIEIK